MTRDKVIHILMMIVPTAIAIAMYFEPTATPRYVSMIGTGLMIAAFVANRLALPPWALDALAQFNAALAQAGGNTSGIRSEMPLRASEKVVERSRELVQ